MRARDRVQATTGGWRGDALVALGLTAFLLVFLALQGLLHGANNLLEAGCAVGAFSCVIVRRAHPGFRPEGLGQRLELVRMTR